MMSDVDEDFKDQCKFPARMTRRLIKQTKSETLVQSSWSSNAIHDLFFTLVFGSSCSFEGLTQVIFKKTKLNNGGTGYVCSCFRVPGFRVPVS